MDYNEFLALFEKNWNEHENQYIKDAFKLLNDKVGLTEREYIMLHFIENVIDAKIRTIARSLEDAHNEANPIALGMIEIPNGGRL